MYQRQYSYHSNNSSHSSQASPAYSSELDPDLSDFNDSSPPKNNFLSQNFPTTLSANPPQSYQFRPSSTESFPQQTLTTNTNNLIQLDSVSFNRVRKPSDQIQFDQDSSIKKTLFDVFNNDSTSAPTKTNNNMKQPDLSSNYIARNLDWGLENLSRDPSTQSIDTKTISPELENNFQRTEYTEGQDEKTSVRASLNSSDYNQNIYDHDSNYRDNENVGEVDLSDGEYDYQYNDENYDEIERKNTSTIYRTSNKPMLYDLAKGINLFSKPNKIFSTPIYQTSSPSNNFINYNPYPTDPISPYQDPTTKNSPVFKPTNSNQKSFSSFIQTKPKTRKTVTFQNIDDLKTSQPLSRPETDRNNLYNPSFEKSPLVNNLPENSYPKDDPLPPNVFLLPPPSTHHFSSSDGGLDDSRFMNQKPGYDASYPPILTSGGRSLQLSSQIPLSKYDQRVVL
ncbi:hypothetical protein BB559_001725 [Furculomyces boomerangus]|uniref:Uncharacterized protein n=1 Tax=Furculomyces boomerangus TaxID=61424 RepID=A0A2T9Z0Y0_9FUNG|nr:hypothetical protein BB559_001725 [Furculomyces boomerangus]